MIVVIVLENHKFSCGGLALSSEQPLYDRQDIYKLKNKNKNKNKFISEQKKSDFIISIHI